MLLQLPAVMLDRRGRFKGTRSHTVPASRCHAETPPLIERPRSYSLPSSCCHAERERSIPMRSTQPYIPYPFTGCLRVFEMHSARSGSTPSTLTGGLPRRRVCHPFRDLLPYRFPPAPLIQNRQKPQQNCLSRASTVYLYKNKQLTPGVVVYANLLSLKESPK